jgi:hypothetical protein
LVLSFIGVHPSIPKLQSEVKDRIEKGIKKMEIQMKTIFGRKMMLKEMTPVQRSMHP